ncbi:hypothetical protein P2318_29685 [Myxococcaceae bacterium GXIMD 01537]
MTTRFDAITPERANELLADALESFFDDDAEELSIRYHDGDLTVEGDFELEHQEVLIVVGNLTVQGCLSDTFLNEDDYSKLYVLGDLRARDMVCGSLVHVTGNLDVDNVLYANSFDMDTLHAGGRLRAKVLIEEGHELEFGSLDVETLITDDETWREVKPDARVGDFAASLPPHLIGHNGRFILSEALLEDLKQGRSVLR